VYPEGEKGKATIKGDLPLKAISHFKEQGTL
jgi:hypothetical protein